ATDAPRSPFSKPHYPCESPLHAIALYADASRILDVFLIEPFFRFGIHVLLDHRQQRHLLLLDVGEHAVAEIASQTREFFPFGRRESVGRGGARDLRHAGADRADGGMLARQMLADAGIA